MGERVRGGDTGAQRVADDQGRRMPRRRSKPRTSATQPAIV